MDFTFLGQKKNYSLWSCPHQPHLLLICLSALIIDNFLSKMICFDVFRSFLSYIFLSQFCRWLLWPFKRSKLSVKMTALRCYTELQNPKKVQLLCEISMIKLPKSLKINRFFFNFSNGTTSKSPCGVEKKNSKNFNFSFHSGPEKSGTKTCEIK